MEKSTLLRFIEPLTEMLSQFDMVLRGFRERNGVKLAGLTCDFIPHEILASFGVVPVRIPVDHGNSCCCGGLSAMGDLAGIYDYIIVPDQCRCPGGSGEKKKVLTFNSPDGYGEESSVKLHDALNEILQETTGRSVKNIDSSLLRERTEEYTLLRRMVRSIAALRREKPHLLSNRNLQTVLDAAALLPPAVTADYLAGLLRALQSIGNDLSPEEKGSLPALVYCSSISGPGVLDDIEETGCLIAEDDSCNGRRQYDMSYNHESEYLYYEILDAFSYRPLCPSIRPAEERYELFYRLLRNHGIELVIFISDWMCPARERDVEYLRIKLMRNGIDPVVVESADAADVVGEYIKMVNR